MSKNIVHLTDDTFETEVMESAKPVLVDFWAEWCGPCKMLAPVLDQVAEQLSSKITIAKVDVDANPETPAKFGIKQIPTLMLFKNGAVEATKAGVLSAAQLTAWIDSHL